MSPTRESEGVLEIQGHCDERFSAVREAFAGNFTVRGDVGASFAATVEGQVVVDLWGGLGDGERGQPWQRDTIVNVYSTTKTMTFLVALMLADQNELDFDAPVSRYWPEFAAHGKGGVLVKHLLAHSAGVPGFATIASVEGLFDWERCIDDLARQEPWWEPGAQSGYHAVTQGYLIGEVVRRITGRSFGRFLASEVTGPLDADFHVGLDRSQFDRVADLIPATEVTSMEVAPDSFMARVFLNPPLPPEVTGMEGWRTAEIPAANGHGNARSVVKVQSVLANVGTAFGKTLLSEAGCRRAAEVQTDGTDVVLGIPLRYCLGYGQTTPQAPITPNPGALFWGGAGGSTITVDMDRRICCAYVMNQMRNEIIGDPRGVALVHALYGCLEA